MSVASGGAAYLARAYGVKTPGVVAKVAPVGTGASVDPAARAQSAAKTSQLVGAVVPGKVDFSGEQPKPSQGAPMAFYGRPTDRNEVATVLSLGKRLDVTG